MEDREFWKRKGLAEIGSLFPNRLVELIGQLEVVGDFGGVFVIASPGSVVADAVGGMVALGNFVGFTANELLEGSEARGRGIDGSCFRPSGPHNLDGHILREIPGFLQFRVHQMHH